MTPQRRIALVSVGAAAVLVVVKLVTGLATDSLGLLSEAAHSGTDLVAALLTLFAVGVAVRPADRGHPYGHGKAEHLAALTEAAFLVAASLFIAYKAVERLVNGSSAVDPAWYALVVVGLVIVVDASRVTVSWRGARRFGSAALEANALHFASDLAGSAAVLVGLALARSGYPAADSVAALFVAVLVLLAAGRLIRNNVDVLMDRSPTEADEAARRAIGALDPPVELRRLRMRRAARGHFADVVIGVLPGAAIGQGHAAADAVEAAVREAVPDADVVVHVEPRSDSPALREHAVAAALAVPGIREVHNVRVVNVDGVDEVSLHLKLPGDRSLEDAHEVASQVERAIERALPRVASVQTHLEPLDEAERAVRPLAGAVEPATEVVLGIVRAETGSAPREMRFIRTGGGFVVFLTLGLDPKTTLADAHRCASEVERRIREARPEIADVIVHTEP